MKIIDFLGATPMWIRFFATALSIVVVVFFSGVIVRNQFTAYSSKPYEELAMIYADRLQLLETTTKLNNHQLDQIRCKMAILEHQKKHHLSIVKKQYPYYFANVSLFPILSAISLVFAFIVMQKGWSEADEYVKVIFLTFSGLAALHSVYPSIYKHSETLDMNLRNYVSLSALQKEMVDYSLTKPWVYGDSLGFDQLLERIHLKENALNEIHFKIEQRDVNRDFLSVIDQ